MSKQNLVGIPWKFSDIWNATLDDKSDRPLTKRDYIYASEIGAPFCDRYLKMYAVPPTNPPNTRSKRKFQAGDIWEWIMGIILVSSGMLKSRQIPVKSKLPRMLPVSGRLDFTVGSPADWSVAKESVHKIKAMLETMNLETPPFFFTAIDRLIDKYKNSYLMDVVLETKAVATFTMEKVQKSKKPIRQHSLQEFHYVYNNDIGIENGKVFYVCKDDCILEEFDISRHDEELFKEYKDDIRQMTKYYNAGFDQRDPTKFMPPREPLILFDDVLFKFQKNLGVEYSPYLNMLYGYETPEKYRNAWSYKATAWSNVFKRAVLEGTYVKRDGKPDLLMKLTPKNHEHIAEASKMFPWKKMVAQARAAGAFANASEDDEEF